MPSENKVILDFFWSASCPHCQDALPFVESMHQEYPWLSLNSYEVSRNKKNAQHYVEMAALLGQEARSVPAFFICGQLFVGYDHADGVGRQLRQALLDCHEGRERSVVNQSPILPFGIEADQLSLPLFTIVMAALDAFNPCAFFVLLSLLSILVNARSRARMLLVGGVFVFISGLAYFLFMAAWLEMFLWAGAVQGITLFAGALAVVIGALNIKDFYYFRQGPSLSIPASAKPGLFSRMRSLVATDRLATLLLGTVSLAVAANSYELLCTVGFPMVFTRVLTLQAGDGVAYYFYLLLYNLIYVMPLLGIVLLFTASMGRRKLSEQEGRGLKLLSGLMMLTLGILLLLLPEALNHVYIGILLLTVALLLTWLLLKLDARRQGR